MEGVMSSDQRKKIHPHKFALWVAMGSIAMMFAGLTSAYVVKQSAGNWRTYDLPLVFWISTLVIVLSSVTVALGLQAFKRRQIPKYKALITTTLILGIAFGVLQYFGFYQLYSEPQQLVINGEVQQRLQTVTVAGNPAESFLFVITGLHLLHILGGIVALAIVFFKAFRKRVKVYNSTGLEIVASYWHFVDVLWIYLFVFFLANQ
jgi:cytochrome c oxidase subunit III